MPQDDFVTELLDTVAECVTLSKPARQRLDAAIRQRWSGAPVYVKRNGPLLRRSIQEATGTHAEIAHALGVSIKTVWRYRKGR